MEKSALSSIPMWVKVSFAAAVLTSVGVCGLFVAASEPGPGTVLTFRNAKLLSMVCWGFGFFLPFSLFTYLDKKLNYTGWAWLGKRRPDKCSSSEPESKGEFLLHKMNSHSSCAMSFSGAYIKFRIFVDECRAPYATLFLALSLTLMGYVSYAWWGSRSSLAWHVDNFLMEIIVSNFGLLFFSILLPEYEILLCMVAVFLILLRSKFRTGEADLLVTGVLSYIAAFYTVNQFGAQGNIYLAGIGFGMMMFGFVPKVADIFDNFPLGTTLFHILESIAWVLIFEWSQTLPHTTTTK